jgi:hypothetical protein
MTQRTKVNYSWVSTREALGDEVTNQYWSSSGTGGHDSRPRRGERPECIGTILPFFDNVARLDICDRERAGMACTASMTSS